MSSAEDGESKALIVTCSYNGRDVLSFTLRFDVREEEESSLAAASEYYMSWSVAWLSVDDVRLLGPPPH